MKQTIAILIFLISNTAFAGTWTNGNLKVKNVIWIPSVKGIYVSPSLFHDPQNCNGTENLYAIDPTLTDSEINQILSITLSAKALDKPIHLWVEGCLGTRPKVKGIQLN